MKEDHAMERWINTGRPGFFGKRRDEVIAGFNAQHGPGNWQLGWTMENGPVLSFQEAVLVYEQAYYRFLTSGNILERLTTEAIDVYDNSLTNSSSGLNYNSQESILTHLQDIALRRCIMRFGVRFRGQEPIQIRGSKGTHDLSRTLSPGQVPFHRPELIHQPALPGWWQGGSIEDWYQSGKILLVRDDDPDIDEPDLTGIVPNNGAVDPMDLRRAARVIVDDGEDGINTAGEYVGVTKANLLLDLFLVHWQQISNLAGGYPPSPLAIIRLLSLFSEHKELSFSDELTTLRAIENCLKQYLEL